MIRKKQIRRETDDDRIDKHLRERADHSSARRCRDLLNKVPDVTARVLQDRTDRIFRVRRKILQKTADPGIRLIDLALNRSINFRQRLDKLRHLLKQPGTQPIKSKDHESKNPDDQDHRTMAADDLQLSLKKPDQRIRDHRHDPPDHKRQEKHHQPQSPYAHRVDDR